MNSTRTPPIVVASLPVAGSVVAYAAVAGPMPVPKMVTGAPAGADVTESDVRTGVAPYELKKL